MYRLEVLFFLFGTSLLFHVQFLLLFLVLHAGFSGGREVVWYSHLFKNFPVVIHIAKVFHVVNEAEIDYFLEFLCLSMIQRMLAI